MQKKQYFSSSFLSMSQKSSSKQGIKVQKVLKGIDEFYILFLRMAITLASFTSSFLSYFFLLEKSILVRSPRLKISFSSSRSQTRLIFLRAPMTVRKYTAIIPAYPFLYLMRQDLMTFLMSLNEDVQTLQQSQNQFYSSLISYSLGSYLDLSFGLVYLISNMECFTLSRIDFISFSFFCYYFISLLFYSYLLD